MNLIELETKYPAVSNVERLAFLRNLLLGPNDIARDLLVTLSRGAWKTVDEIVRLSGCSYPTARLYLPKLVRAGLIDAMEARQYTAARIVYLGHKLIGFIEEFLKDIHPDKRLQIAERFGIWPPPIWNEAPAASSEIHWFKLYNMSLIERLNSTMATNLNGMPALPAAFAATFGYSRCNIRSVYRRLGMNGKSCEVRKSVGVALDRLMIFCMIDRDDKYLRPRPNTRLALPYAVRTMGRQNKRAMLDRFPWIAKILPID